MYIPKRYGESKIDRCPFCSKTATSINKQGIPTCQKHKDRYLPALKCVCGETLDLKQGKFGPYFSCMNCGNMNFKKAMELNPNIKEDKKVKKSSEEMTVTSDEVDFI